MSALILLPNTLFEYHEIYDQVEKIYLIEHGVYFEMYTYHQMKLVMHRATMKHFYDQMEEYPIQYIEYNENIEPIFKKHKEIYYLDPCDHHVTQEFEKLSTKYKTKLHCVESDLFMISKQDLEDYAKNKTKFLHKNFYLWFRKKYHVMMKNGPEGGKWSYDTENRQPFPKNYQETYKIKKSTSPYVKEAIRYVKKHFSDHPGDPNYYLPISHTEAKKHLQTFIKQRLQEFGPYEDAVRSDVIIGNHSILSPLMNIGLLTPQMVMDAILETKGIPIASKEAFVRQLTWREYSRLLYLSKREEMENLNYFKSTQDLDEDVWYYHHGKVGIPLIDDMIDKTLKYGYLHHIERLMYIGNFLCLNEIEPSQVFNWFQSMFIDSYHVFMYFNVYAMSQHSCGDLAMRKPYIASSNYASKMSDYKRTPKDKENPEHWSYDWDQLYWNFIRKHKPLLKGIFQVSKIKDD